MSKQKSYLYANLNWKDLEALKQKEKFVLLLPIGAAESHGPHCPIATDTIIALEVCLSAAKRLHRRGYEAYILPPFSYTVAECARNFPGTISIAEETERTLISEILLQLIGHGMSKICIVNHHGEPGNVRAIYDALDKVFEQTGVRVAFPNIFRRKYVTRLPDAVKKGETHADQYETSLILAIDPSLVNEARRKKLRYLPINLADKLFKECLDEFKAMGMDECYCGDPAAGTAEEGKETLNTLSDFIVEAVEEMFTGKIPDEGRGLFGKKVGGKSTQMNSELPRPQGGASKRKF